MKGIEMSHEVKQMNLWQRIHYAGEELKGRVAKDKRNDFDRYDYASHDGVVAHVRPALQAARIVLTIEPGDFSVDSLETSNKQGQKSTQIFVKGLMQAVLHNIDKPEDVYSIPIPVMALDRGDKAHGKAISYGKKYAITACIGLLLATGDDTDSDAAEITQPEKAKHTPPPKAPPKQPEKPKDPPKLAAAKKELNEARIALKLEWEDVFEFCVKQEGRELKELNDTQIKTLTAKLEMAYEGKYYG
jgi:hypothetical protein